MTTDQELTFACTWRRSGGSAPCCRTVRPLAAKTLSLVKCLLPLGFVLIPRAILGVQITIPLWLWLFSWCRYYNRIIIVLYQNLVWPCHHSKDIRKESLLVSHTRHLPEPAYPFGFPVLITMWDSEESREESSKSDIVILSVLPCCTPLCLKQQLSKLFPFFSITNESLPSFVSLPLYTTVPCSWWLCLVVYCRLASIILWKHSFEDAALLLTLCSESFQGSPWPRR